jgi:hypothetical protein
VIATVESIFFFQSLEWRRRAIATPSPPHRSALALVKLLPFPLIIFTHDGGATVNPDSLRCASRSAASRTAKSEGVGRLVCPFRRSQVKSFHCTTLYLGWQRRCDRWNFQSEDNSRRSTSTLSSHISDRHSREQESGGTKPTPNHQPPRSSNEVPLTKNP